MIIIACHPLNHLMLKNLSDLYSLFFIEWKLTYKEVENSVIVPESNIILSEYCNKIGASIPKNNIQDHLQINLISDNLIGFISENSGNWNIATNDKSEVLSNECWLYTENEMSNYILLEQSLEECLISYSLQEMYFANYENKTSFIKKAYNFQPLWINKRYSSNEATHSFYYDTNYKALQFVHCGNPFDKVVTIQH